MDNSSKVYYKVILNTTSYHYEVLHTREKIAGQPIYDTREEAESAAKQMDANETDTYIQFMRITSDYICAISNINTDTDEQKNFIRAMIGNAQGHINHAEIMKGSTDGNSTV